MTKGFKDLVVWQKAKDLVTYIYLNTKDFPKEEIYGITSQIRRSAISISSNLAEGYGRTGKNEFAHFVSIAFASACELENLIIIASELKYFDSIQRKKMEEDLDVIMRMLQRLRQSLRKTS